ncbi:hypothetical protein L228DRAFT_143907 [Xylona heveae TC161]|uniref:DUF7770 domain-containing protein n=1 Tax=Xylona heveae (strain CBS 132557 / TC161) TaxID=1328760 RepID=A0A165GAZ0_XYLHT|nr:hypothetical protein L228DRAFT_143907 [Xylona heveae TC161]KZF21964.1 hypothetical protein L228DRAFT_143907 [Xylona heveae TC161]
MQSFYSSLTEEQNALRVEAVRVTVLSVGYVFDSDTRSGNLASIYLLTSDGNSVRLNMTKANITHTMGTLEVKHCIYRDAYSSLANYNLEVRDNLTVGNVLDLLLELGRDKYRLSASRLGCRFWVTTIIDDLENYGHMSPTNAGNSALVGRALQYNYTGRASPEFEPMVPVLF